MKVRFFFLLDRPYHFPPDSVQHTANRKEYMGVDIDLGYDPLAVNPDYIIVGRANEWWHIYDEVIASNKYTLVFEKSIYQIYKKSS